MAARRADTLAGHVLATAGVAAAGGAAVTPPDRAENPAAETVKTKAAMSPEQVKELARLYFEFIDSTEKLVNEGELPRMSLWDLLLAMKHELGVAPKKEVARVIEEAEREGSDDLKILNTMPGPWRDCKNREEQLRLVRQVDLNFHLGMEQQEIARWQLKYGDRGLGSNIAVPKYEGNSVNSISTKKAHLRARVIVADPADAERISRRHVRKEDGFFQEVLYDSVISTLDNDHWKKQRAHLAEVFMPLSSLAQILPVSRARARHCAERLAEASAGGKPVDMSEFLLHEAQAQLQLALLGTSEEFMETTNADIRAAFMGDVEEGKVGELGKAMQALMEMAQSDQTLALPTDAAAGCPVRGPLARALQTSGMAASANYGNMLLVLFAGHDTTGHTMTWLLFELARHPEIQTAVHAEAKAFFEGLQGRDPEYKDFGKGDLTLLDRCITETLRLWPAVANGTFRQLQFVDSVRGPDGDIELPRGTSANIVHWSRHRNPDLWGPDVNEFNPHRNFSEQELVHVGCPMAAVNPQSQRYSPFAHGPRNCLGRNFAQMEMRLILLYLLSRFEFSLAPPYDTLMGMVSSATPGVNEFRGVNRGTMGPMDLERTTQHSWGERHQYAMKMHVKPRP